MFKILVKKQIAEIFRSYLYNEKKKRKRTKKETIGCITGFALLMAVLIGGTFAFVAASMCKPFAQIGMGWIYFAVMGLISILLGAFGSVFNTFSGLYMSKDNDLLLSMPIPVTTIMGARLAGVYIMGAMYSLPASLPAVIVYFISGEFTIKAVIGGLFYMVDISLIVFVISCALGWVVAKISKRLKSKGIITAIISVFMIGAYYVGCGMAPEFVKNLIESAPEIGGSITGFEYIPYMMGRCGEGYIVPCLVFTGCILVFLAITWFVMDKTFLKMTTASERTSRNEYKEKEINAKGLLSALTGRELLRFRTSANYMLNCGLAMLFLPLAGIAALLKAEEFSQALLYLSDMRAGAMAVIIICAICLISGMNNMAVPSFSLEGKTMWIIRSLPVEPWEIIKAKALMQIILSVIPVVVCQIFMIAALPFNIRELAFVVIIPIVFTVVFALFSVYIGITHVNLNWSNEIIPIKQSIGVLLSLLGAAGYTVGAGGVYMLIGYRMGASSYLCIILVITLLIGRILMKWIRTKGTEVFEELI